MISERTRGLQHILLLCQAFLAGLALAVVMCVSFGWLTGATGLHLEHYPIYWGILVLGLVIESLNRQDQSVSADLFQRSLLHQHGVSLRQTVYAAVALLLYLAITKDAFISRTVLLL